MWEHITSNDFREGCDKAEVVGEDGEIVRTITEEQVANQTIQVEDHKYDVRYRCNGEWQDQAPNQDSWYEFLANMKQQWRQLYRR